MVPGDVDAVVFDFDGLLMDTEWCLTESWRFEWGQHGLVLDLDSFWVEHGGDVSQERYRLLADAVGAGYDRDASHARREQYRQKLLDALELSPGIAAWLDEARDAGLRLAVASSSSRGWVTSRLDAVGRQQDFEVYACGDEVPHPKPAPDVYRLALDRLGVTPQRAVAVEDAAHGVRAAQAAGLRCIAIPNPHVGRASCDHADLVLTSAAETSLTDALAAIARF